ncbi:MAG: MIP/aquaporin family protein [Pseudomonadota bacterium]
MASQRWFAEFIGTAFLLIAVVGSGIMAEDLSGGNVGVALLANAIATGCALYFLITIFGPISGAHFNPAVTIAFLIRGEIKPAEATGFIAAQIVGGILGVWLAHIMFDLTILQFSSTERASVGKWTAEIVATFGLLTVIFGGIRHRPEAVPTLVALYITGAYWFTASTSFANPAVTIARTLSDTFAGIYPGHAPMFILCQMIGMGLAVVVAARLFR